MKIKIKVTKEILQASSMCGYTKETKDKEALNCAFSLAVREILPQACVHKEYIIPFGTEKYNEYVEGVPRLITIDEGERERIVFRIPEEMGDFISWFDMATPAERLSIHREPEFELDLPEWVVDNIGDGNLEETKRIISQSKTLELV